MFTTVTSPILHTVSGTARVHPHTQIHTRTHAYVYSTTHMCVLHACSHTHTHTCEHTHLSLCLHVFSHSLCTHIHSLTSLAHTPARIHVYTCVHTHTHTHTHTHVHALMCLLAPYFNACKHIPAMKVFFFPSKCSVWMTPSFVSRSFIQVDLAFTCVGKTQTHLSLNALLPVRTMWASLWTIMQRVDLSATTFTGTNWQECGSRTTPRRFSGETRSTMERMWDSSSSRMDRYISSHS